MSFSLLAGLPREMHLPDAAKATTPMTPAGTDLVIYSWTDPNGRLRAMAFQGRADKPLFNYQFRSEAGRQDTIDRAVAQRRTTFDEKMKAQQQKKEFAHGLARGDILYSSWGYDQTNVDFYEVTAVSGKAVVIREIAKKSLSSGGGVDKVVAVKGHFVGDAMKKIPQMGYKGEAYIKLTSFSSAHPWDGTPKQETSGGYGH